MVTNNQTENKSILQVTLTIEEQTLTKVMKTFAQVFQSTASDQSQPNVTSLQLEALQKVNANLMQQVQNLQTELARIQAQLAKQEQSNEVAQQAKPSDNGTAIQPSETHSESQPKAVYSGVPSQVKPGYVQPEKAEQWAREHLEEWLDNPCSFAKAQGRTWRELAENQGEKILVNGRPCSPRAYLHALESWAACKVWQRMKAKVALEVGKNGNGIENHLAAISG